ncbi:hypothetical protein B566_EDAN007865, partial [Ephemera danica]
MNATDSLISPLIGSLDLGVFGAMLGASAIIGVYFGCCSGRKQSASEYLMGGKTMSIVPIALSLVASAISGITVLGVPSEIYRFGTQYWMVCVSGFLVSLTAGYFYIPVYVECQVDSCYQYLELRFNKKVRRFASFMFVISQYLNTPIVIYVPALAFSQVTGINVHHVTPITCMVCIFYTTLGGLRAVVWADALQTVLMFAATIAVLVLGTEQLGGWSEVWNRNEQGQRLEFFKSLLWFSIGFSTIKAIGIATGLLVFAFYYDCDPLSTKSTWDEASTFCRNLGLFLVSIEDETENELIKNHIVTNLGSKEYWTSGTDFTNENSWIWSSTGQPVIFTDWLFGEPNNANGNEEVIKITLNNGVLAWNDCAINESPRVQRTDQLLPLLVLETTSHLPGLSGLFLAGVFSAAL